MKMFILFSAVLCLLLGVSAEANSIQKRSVVDHFIGKLKNSQNI